MRRYAGLAILTALVATPAVAAPLCRDGKGLFTPCPPAELARVRAEQAHHVERRRVQAETRRAQGKPPQPETIATGRLCRDSKGLFTPCPR